MYVSSTISDFLLSHLDQILQMVAAFSISDGIKEMTAPSIRDGTKEPDDPATFDVVDSRNAAIPLIPLWLEGKEIRTSNTFYVYSTISGIILYQATAATRHVTEAALSSAQKASGTWLQSSVASRNTIFLRVAEILGARREECWNTIRHETHCSRTYFDYTFDLSIEACKDVVYGPSSRREMAWSMAREETSTRSGVVLGIVGS